MVHQLSSDASGLCVSRSQLPSTHPGPRPHSCLHLSTHFYNSEPHLPTMQRPAYSIPPANSPPLHHPVPQHVSTVPQLRSPPPPASSANGQQGAYGYGQSPAQGGGQAGGSNNYMHPAFGGFINDPTAQLGFQMGKSAVDAGQQYAEQTVSRPTIPFSSV